MSKTNPPQWAVAYDVDGCPQIFGPYTLADAQGFADAISQDSGTTLTGGVVTYEGREDACVASCGGALWGPRIPGNYRDHLRWGVKVLANSFGDVVTIGTFADRAAAVAVRDAVTLRVNPSAILFAMPAWHARAWSVGPCTAEDAPGLVRRAMRSEPISAAKDAFDSAPAVSTTATIKTTPDPLRHFAWQHLPPALQDVSRRFENLAAWCVESLPAGEERHHALRRLLEAKDCAVRAARDGGVS